MRASSLQIVVAALKPRSRTVEQIGGDGDVPFACDPLRDVADMGVHPKYLLQHDDAGNWLGIFRSADMDLHMGSVTDGKIVRLCPDVHCPLPDSSDRLGEPARNNRPRPEVPDLV